MENRFYVYVHFKLGTDIPFYVGKGTGMRKYSHSGRNQYWKNIVKKYEGREVLVIEDNLSDIEACELEIYWISQLKNWGFKLCNITDGGEAGRPGGWNHTEEAKKKLSIAHTGKIISEKTKINMSKGQIGRKFSKEHSSKISNSLIGNNNSKTKIVLDTETGIYFENIKQASIAYNINYSTLIDYLNGNRKNKTNLITT